MLTTIKQLEKEIDEFHNNIAGSNELLKLIVSLTNAVKDQSERLEERSIKFEKLISNLPDDVKIKNDNLLQELKNNFKSEQTNLIEEISQFYKKYMIKIDEIYKKLSGLPQELTKDNNEVIEKIIIELKSIQAVFVSALEIAQNSFISKSKFIEKSMTELPEIFTSVNALQLESFLNNVKTDHDKYINELKSTRQTIEKFELITKEKYTAFIEKLESTNIDQIYIILRKIDKSINNKFTILLSGCGIIIVLIIISYFI